MKVRLIDSEVIECADKYYAIEVYQGGWMAICTFPLTEDGYKQAECVMKYLSHKYARISMYS